MFRIRIRRADDDCSYSGGDDGVRAGWRAAVSATWFERDVKRRAAWIVTALLSVAERLDFRVRQTRAPMPAAADDFPAFHQHRADHRIRRSRAEAAPCEPKGEAHELVISHHAHRIRWRLPRQSQKATVGNKTQTERATSRPAGRQDQYVTSAAGLMTQMAEQVAEQKIFVVRLVIGDLDGGIRVEVIGGGIFLAQNLAEISRRVFHVIPFQKILPCACGHSGRHLLRFGLFNGFHRTQHMHAPALHGGKTAHIRE